MRVLKQLGKEFLLPFVLSILWTFFSFKDATKPPISSLIGTFGASFAFSSYILSQIWRVIKQQKVESSLTKIEMRVDKTLADLEARTRDVVSHITGGESFCYITIARETDDGVSEVWCHHVGAHMLYDVAAIVFDEAVYVEHQKPFSIDIYARNEAILEIKNIHNGYTVLIPNSLRLGTAHERKLRVLFTARNGHFQQELTVKRMDGKIECFVRVFRDDQEILALGPGDCRQVTHSK